MTEPETRQLADKNLTEEFLNRSFRFYKQHLNVICQKHSTHHLRQIGKEAFVLRKIFILLFNAFVVALPRSQRCDSTLSELPITVKLAKAFSREA